MIFQFSFQCAEILLCNYGAQNEALLDEVGSF